VFVTLRVVVLAVVLGNHAMRFGRGLVMLCGFGVGLVRHGCLYLLFAGECRADRSGSNSVRRKAAGGDLALAFLF